LILSGPPLLFAAFFLEATRFEMNGFLVSPTIIAVLLGTLCHLAASVRRDSMEHQNP